VLNRLLSLGMSKFGEDRGRIGMSAILADILLFAYMADFTPGS